MEKLLQQLYYGSVEGLDGAVRENAAYKKALRKYQDSREDFEKKLPADLRKEFHSCLSCCKALGSEAEEAAFGYGIRFGITIMMEAFFLIETDE